MKYVGTFKKWIASCYHRVTDGYKRIASLFNSFLNGVPYASEYRDSIDRSFWPVFETGDVSIIDKYEVQDKLKFPFPSFDLSGQEAFELLYLVPDEKWEQDYIIADNHETYMGKLILHNRCHHVWWSSNEESYLAKEC